MRLDTTEVRALIDAVSHFLSPDFVGVVLLYGSQVDERRRGGDIDLVLFAEDPAQARSLSLIDYKIVARIKQQPAIGDRRIDFRVLTTADVHSPFFTEALKPAVTLKTWARRN